MPEPTLRRETVGGSLVAVPLETDVLRRPIGIIHHYRKVFTPTAAKFVEMLQQAECNGPTQDDRARGPAC